MNELDLFEKWFEKQTQYDIVKRKKNWVSGSVPLKYVRESYIQDRDSVIVKEAILFVIKQNKDNKYVSDEKLSELIMEKLDGLKKQVIP